MPMHSIVHLVLYFLEKEACSRSILVIVYCRSIYIRQFLIEPTFTQSYFSNLGKQMLKIILTDKRTVLHSLLVNHITTDGKLTKHTCTPLPKLGCPNRIDSIPDTNNGIEIIECRIVILAIRSSCFHFGNN